MAGNETTRNAITGGLLAFSPLPRPEADGVHRRPELVDTAVDEIVRYVSPVHRVHPHRHRGPRVHGRQLKAGDKVLMLYQSANRDERRLRRARRASASTATRTRTSAFGIGPHYCLGANLARAEMKVVFQELFQRLHDIHGARGRRSRAGRHRRSCSRSQHLPAGVHPGDDPP